MQTIESERIVNIEGHDSLVLKARTQFHWLESALERKDLETALNLTKQIDLTLHELELYEFQIERRTITVNSPVEH